MKSQFLVSCFAIILAFSGSYCQGQSKATNDSAAIMLKQFYTSYITASEESLSEKELNLIRKQYCTPKILNRIAKDEELDSDPFVNAQDTNMDWLRTLVISKDPQKANVYIVSYLDTYSQKRTIIKLLVVKKGQAYKIDDILTY